MNKSFSVSFLCLILLAVSTTAVLADEIVISGNGESSINEVKAESSSNQNVQQTNDGYIENTVQTDANTGENKASDNTNGSVDIQTGDAASSTDISNSANSNQASSTCDCPTPENTAVVSGNGSESNNLTSYTTQTTVNGLQTNKATITNTIVIQANTGNNTANDNNGDVTIKTGSITTNTTVLNQNINSSKISFPFGNSSLNALIFGNGSQSINTVFAELNTTYSLVSNNNANIFNNILNNLNTGGNKADGNNGSVLIATGDIQANISIENNDINSNETKIDCCKKEEQKPPVGGENPKPTQPTLPTSGGGGNGGSSGGVGGTTLGTTTKGVLPVTGSYFLFLALIFNSIMFLCGGLLRLRSGRSPGVAFAYTR